MNGYEDIEDEDRLESFEQSTPIDDDIRKRSGCIHPLCGGALMTRALIKELRVVQGNQRNQQNVWEKFLEHQREIGQLIANMVNFKDQLDETSRRISEAHKIISEIKVAIGSMIPSDQLVKKSDMKWFIGYTLTGLTILLGLFGMLMKLTGKG